MSEAPEDSTARGDDAGLVSMDLFEEGGVEGSDFRTKNLAPDQYHRAEVLQRTGAVSINCNLTKVIHGIMSEDGNLYATLLIMEWTFQATGTRRISEATIELEFEASSREGTVEVEKVSFPGSYSLMPTTQEETITKGGEATVGIEQFAALSLTGKWEKSVAKSTTDAITLSGSRRVVNNVPPNRIATWTLTENASQPAGIPSLLKVAVLVSRDDREKFYCKLGFSCKTDMKTSFGRLFKKIPKDDPIIFQPDPEQKGTRPNRNVEYGDKELELVDLEDLGDVTFRTVLTNAQKTR
ncbi:hypothetical protein F5X68DRAFT_259576 [Plectosphaerella plurivora]|uniref:Uncharacterized protein n=1 Tax=Plectosphaerella plurivora TaxID=936078 RepID=A0A9P8VIT6_9PEZI|nr:hypothetical protein F5X68DRAFT_259576 [Plectosphaerella plurivora]